MTIERPSARLIRPGEMIAMHAGYLHQGPGAFFWMFGGGVVPNERIGNVAIVHIRDGLEHHAAGSWGADSYESILARYADALCGADVVAAHRQTQREHRWAHEYEDGYEPLADIEPTPPSAVVFCIDSPGGVVSGLTATAEAIQKMRAESGVPLIAYVNELAASAAYALACACDEIVCPKAAIVGSIGVISTMISQASKNAKDGFDVRLLTSGARKADGNVHAPITDDAVEAETGRVDRLAMQFFRLAAKSRKLSIDKVRGLQAGIFLGAQAEANGLVDDVLSLDDAILALQSTESHTELDTLSGSGSLDTTPAQLTENRMPLKLSSKRVKLEAAVAVEKDPKRLVEMNALLAAYKKVEKHVEHTKSEEDDDDDDEEPEDEGDKKKKDEDAAAAKKKADDEAASAAAEEESAEGDDDAKKASAALAMIEAATGEKGARALGAARALFASVQSTAADVAQLKAEKIKSDKAALIRGAVASNHMTEGEAKHFSSRPLSEAEGFVAYRRKSGTIVNTDERELVQPKAGEPGTEASLSADVIKMIDAACSASPLADKKAFRATLVDAHLKAHKERLGAAVNGAPGRY